MKLHLPPIFKDKTADAAKDGADDTKNTGDAKSTDGVKDTATEAVVVKPAKKPLTPEEQKERKKKIRKRILMALFVLLNIAIIAWTAFSEFGNSENAASLADVKIKWWLILPAALVFTIAVVAEIAKYFIMTIHTHSAPDGANRRKLWKISQRTVLLGRYYDNITPAAVGGQPFQIYYMYKSGIKNGYGAVIPLVSMITDQLGFLILGLFSIIIGGLFNAIWSPAIVAIGWIGLLVNGFMPLVILAATFLPKTTEEIMNIGIKFLHKIHIIKDRDAATEKATESVRQYAAGIKTILREKGLFLKMLLLSMAYYFCILTIPYFVLSAFGAEIGFFACFATTTAVTAAVYFIPTPGNAGAAEGTFYSVFSVLPVSGYVFWAMLLWRFFVYYLWLLLGIFTQSRIYVEDKNLVKNWGEKVDDFEAKTVNNVKSARKSAKIS